MDESSRYLRIISGRDRSVSARLARSLLNAASLGYAGAVRLRNAWYDTVFPTWLEVPVISIGNLTVGGTGKTPMTQWFCERLLERGRKPAVLCRGYKAAAGGFADELMLITRRCPQAVAVANPDRLAAGSLAVADYGAQAVVLDDGYQYRRMGRDLDILLIDATRPFGYQHLLPRGLLREPIIQMRRADAVVITRCDQVEPQAIQDLIARIGQTAPDRPVVRARHLPVGFTDLAGHPIEKPNWPRPGVFCGIARPETFSATLAAVGLPTDMSRAWPDHHDYSPQDVQELHSWVHRERLDGLITTEKDAVKLERLKADWPVPVAVLRVSIDISPAEAKILTDLIDQMLEDHTDHEQAEPTIGNAG